MKFALKIMSALFLDSTVNRSYPSEFVTTFQKPIFYTFSTFLKSPMHGDRSEEHREIAVCNNFFKFSTTKIVIHDEIYSFNMSRHSHLSLSHDE